jgi:hypothetical protein
MASSRRPRQLSLLDAKKDTPAVEAARIILAERDRYGGQGSLMVRWANSVLGSKQEKTP